MGATDEESVDAKESRSRRVFRHLFPEWAECFWPILPPDPRPLHEVNRETVSTAHVQNTLGTGMQSV